MTSRRVFLRRTLLGVTTITSMPTGLKNPTRPLLWIADPSGAVTNTLQLLMQHHDLAETRSFSCKQQALASLRSQTRKPTLLITDFFGGSIRGDDFICLARTAAPMTKLILFNAVVGNLSAWRAISDAPAPDVIVAKPDIQKLLTVVKKFELTRAHSFRRLIEI